MRHLRLEHAIHHVGCTVRCGQDACPRTFNQLRYFKSHLSKRHAELLCNDGNDDGCHNADGCNPPDVEDMDVSSLSADDPAEELIRPDINLTASFMVMIEQLECKSNLTKANIQMIVENISVFLEDVSQYCSQRVTTLLSELKVPKGNAAAECCVNELANLPNWLTPVNTEYKRTKYLAESEVVINPVELVLGTRREMRFSSVMACDVDTNVEDTMQYVRIDMVLGAILLNKSYRDMMAEFAVKCKLQQNGVIGHYFHTDAYKQHPFFKQFPDGLALNLYIDAFETTNVLGSHTGIHKLEGLYMTVQNFPPEYQSQLSSVFLVALWYANDVKEYGYDKILEPIINSLLRLESESGCEVTIGQTTITVRACLVFLSADNLGYNSLFGYNESFSAMKYCRFCESTREEIDSHFLESKLKLRSKKSYDQCVASLCEPGYDQQATGIKRGCLLNKLKYWHVTENFVVDVLHDILQGVAGLEISLVFAALAADKQCKLSLDAVNAALNNFNYSFADKNSRPPMLSSLTTIKMSASEMWCFLRNLPLLVGNLIPREQEHWQLLKMLLDITDIVLAPTITANLCSYLGRLVEDHHTYFKTLFPGKQLTPKQHFLVHYAKCLEMSGPPVRYWTMRFEARHQIFKDLAKNTNCFKNVCQTLAKRFQRIMAINLKNHVINKFDVTGPAEEMLVKEFVDPVCDAICGQTGVCRNDSIYVLKWVKVGHYCIKPSAVTVNSVDSEGIPHFGIVTDIISVNDCIYFVENVLLTSHYDDHFHAYSVSYPSQRQRVCLPLQSVLDHVPLQFHIIKYEGEQHMFISLRSLLLQRNSSTLISVTGSQQFVSSC